MALGALPQLAMGQAGTARKSHLFTVRDDIQLIRFPQTIEGLPVRFSPDGHYFLITSERGRLDLNRPESSIRIYRTRDTHQFLVHPETAVQLPPVWTITKSTYKNGPIISNVRWLRSSRGIAFLAKTSDGKDQLFLADLGTRTVRPLTPENQHVTGFDVRRREEFIYAVLSPAIRQQATRSRRPPAFIATGHSLDSILFPEQHATRSVWAHDLSELWAVLANKRFRVVDTASGRPLPIHLDGQRALALSPNGHIAVTALTVSDVPPEWETIYPAAASLSPYRIRAGPQNPYALNGLRDVSQYVLIDLATGGIKPLTKAPIGNAAGWWGTTRSDWSADGRSILLPDTFLPPETRPGSALANRPCVAVADLRIDRVTCLERLQNDSDNGNRSGRRYIYGAQFVPGAAAIQLNYSDSAEGFGSETFLRLRDGSWRPANPRQQPLRSGVIDVSINQDLNDPPAVVATDLATKVSRAVWNPNPQLRDVNVGEVSVLKWKDKSGRDWVGGLYKPPDYSPGKRYPLVIQTHGFAEHEFRPSGAFPTAFAAQELAAAGFLVLQVSDCPIRNAPEEGSCQVTGYEAVVNRLVAEGLVDQDRLGIIGFSRTCYYVLEALTTSALHFAAASITDGVNFGYLQYLMNLDVDSTDSIAREGNSVMGASPFGTGLALWFKRSPDFNMDKVSTPLQVVATKKSVLQMWEPYAALRYLHKPVELLVLDSDEHVLSNPLQRLISQSNTVEWFRFWLQDSDRAETLDEKYLRWRGLRSSQEQEQYK